jgi:5-methylcytosine-specific restriction endonuclease McrBC regulatory subunit McrC
MAQQKPIRVREWGNVKTDLTAEQRERLEAIASHISPAPFWFGGANGQTLHTRQFVGVIECGDVAVEIYPKLDAAPDEQTINSQSVLRNLLWLLEVSGYERLVEPSDGSLTQTPDSYSDVFALLMARRLYDELARGVPRRYERFEEDIKTIRGRLLVGVQATRHFNRMDKIACAFDEFTSDTPVCQILRCACKTLAMRVRLPEARRLLDDCTGLLDEVTDISIVEALRLADNLPPWGRDLERFRRPYDVAVRLLRGFSHEMTAGIPESFVFLLDMNALFESYVAAVLEASFGVPIETQKHLGYLLTTKQGRMAQIADFVWKDKQNITWIGDAKYKHLAKMQDSPLTFATFTEDETAPAGRLLDTNDIRQLTVYAELQQKEPKIGTPKPHIALFYPYVGSAPLANDHVEAWNGSLLYLVPIRVKQCKNIADALVLSLAKEDLQ